jgi:tetratricopeptide (TPR) repeat protein
LQNSSSQAVEAAVGALQRVSETTPGERGRRASVVALVLRTVEDSAAAGESGDFLRRRAGAELDRLPKGAERALLRRILKAALADRGIVAGLLSDLAAGLDESRRLEEAGAVIELAAALAPDRADIALRAGRIARLQGDADSALALYRRASELDGAGGSVARLAAVGEAAITADPERALAMAVREAVVAGDQEAAAVGLEERARVRRARGYRTGAVRDLLMAGVRYADPVDRARTAHQLADLFVAANDPLAAREALLFALRSGDSTQREHAQARLHAVSRDIGDQVGMRRWRSFRRPALVSLSARPNAVTGKSAAAGLARWRARLGR